MDNDDLKNLREDMAQQHQERIARASAEALALVASLPAATFRFNAHAMNGSMAPFAVYYTAANAEGEELCAVLRASFPRTRGFDTDFTAAFNAFVAKAQDTDCVVALPDGPDHILSVRMRGPIAVRKPLSFKKQD